MKPFVGVTEKALQVPELLDLITKLAANKPSYYFLRWTYKVSGIQEQPLKEQDFPMTEGQMFNHDCELRWRYKPNNTYEVLLLTIADNHDTFIPIKEIITKEEEEEKVAWRIEPNDAKKFPSYAYPAYGYSRDTTRFPKQFNYPESLDIRGHEDNKKQPKLAQRYFIDNETSTVQFVALTVEVEPT